MLHTNVYILIIYALLFSTDANVSNTSDPHNIISLQSSIGVSNVRIITFIKTLHCRYINKNVEIIVTQIPHRSCLVDNFLNNDNFNDVKLFVKTDNNVARMLKLTTKLRAISEHKLVDIFTFVREMQNNLFDHEPLACSF